MGNAAGRKTPGIKYAARSLGYTLAAMAAALIATASSLAAAPFPPPPDEPFPHARDVTFSGPQRPNVIVILTDDMREDELRHMPHTKRLLARRGVRFANAFHSNPLCCPARVALLTGQYSHNNGIWSNKSNEPRGGGFADFRETQAYHQTLPKWLRIAGYHTAFVGRYLNGYPKHGNAKPEPGWSEWRGISGKMLNYRDTIISHNGTERRTRKYITHKLNTIGVNVIDRRAFRRKPFFLWLAHVAPHGGSPHEADDPPDLGSPHVAPRDRDTSDIQEPKTEAFNEEDVSDKPAHIRNLELLDDDLVAQTRERRQQRVESLQAVDRGIRRVVRALRRAGELRNTYIVFTSDNGHSLGEHRRRGGKRLPYRENISAPLLMRGPGLPAHDVVRQPVAAMQDIAPTVLHWAGRWGSYCCKSSPVSIDGRTLVPLIAHPERGGDRPILLEGTFRYDGDTQYYQGVRTTRGIYVDYTTGEEELYEWQLSSLHDEPGFDTAKEDLSATLERLRECSGGRCRR